MKKLEGRFLEPRSGKAKQMVMFLHGYGANGDDLLNIGEDWGDELPEAVFLSPNAPDVCEAFAGGYQWFSIRAIDEKAFERDKPDRAGVSPCWMPILMNNCKNGACRKANSSSPDFRKEQ